MSYVRSPFTACPQSAVTTVSSWKEDLSTASAGTQTDAFTTSDGCTQFPEVRSCQTETCARSVGPSNQVSPTPDLHNFLTKALAVTEKEMQDSLSHHPDWDAIRKLMPSGDESAVLLHSIHPLASEMDDQSSGRENDTGDFVVSAVEWNCNSSMLAITFKNRMEHESWCSHESPLLFFSLYRSYDRNSIPSFSLQVPCITVLKSHPLIATVYAMGAHNGKLLVVDTKDCNSSKKNAVRTSSPDHLHHEHAVSHLHWTTGAKRNESVLVSLGTDGRIFLWVLNLLDLNDFTPSKAFSVSTQDLGRSLPAHSEKSNLRSEVGITAASFSFEHENLFVIGCCGGALLLCSLQPAQEVAPSLQSANEQDLNFATPVQMAYIAHRSTVCCVDFSATGRNLFLSASVDGEMRVYNALDSKPVALMHLEFGLASACFWSRERPVIYCLASGGTVRSIVLIHDGSHQSRLCYSSSPFLTTDEEEVSNLWLNCWKRSSEELALLSARGELSIWKRTN